MSAQNPEPMKTRVIGFFKDHYKIGLFFLFNSILPFSDVITDSLTSFNHHKSGHVLWARMTFFLMWNPFLAHLLAFLFTLFKSTWSKNEEFDPIHELKRLVFFLPFVTPIKNVYYGIKLYRLRFGMGDFEAKNAKEVERIQQEAGFAGMYESFLESGPQAVLQMKIILSTGSVSVFQIISVVISIVTLALASSRAFFIQRDKDSSDPDPDLVKMVVLGTFPWMLLNVAHSLTMWTFIAGLLGRYAIPSCLVYLLATFALQKSGKEKQVSLLLLAVFLLTNLFMFFAAVKTHLTMLPSALLVLLPLSAGMVWIGILRPAISFGKQLLEARSQVETENKESYFSIKSALTSIWLPCVVGQRPYMFILPAIASLAFKNLLFITAVILNHYKVIEINVFVLWCVDETKFYEAQNITVCHSLQSCFTDITWSATTEQKVRVCQESQDDNLVFFALYILTGLYLLSIFSAIASFKLDKITDYTKFYQATKTFLGYESDPVVHRSLVFTLASKDENYELLEEVTEYRAMINRQRRGETPLHYSTKLKAVRCTEILLRKGAKLTENGENPPEVPSIVKLAVQSRYAPILDEIARIKRQSPDTKFLGDGDIMLALQEQDDNCSRDQTLMETSLGSPVIVRSILNLLLPMATSRSYPATPELKFLQERLREVTPSKDDTAMQLMMRKENILTVSTVTSLMTWRNKSGWTVLHDQTLAKNYQNMMLTLALSILDNNLELIPEVRAGILNAGNPDFIKSLQMEDKFLSCSTITALITHTNSEDKTVLQEKEIMPETYDLLVSLALSVLQSVSETDDEKEEAERAKMVVEILPELAKIQNEKNDKRVSSQLSIFLPKMKSILSKKSNKKIKEVLQSNGSIPIDVKKALGLESI